MIDYHTPAQPSDAAQLWPLLDLDVRLLYECGGADWRLVAHLVECSGHRTVALDWRGVCAGLAGCIPMPQSEGFFWFLGSSIGFAEPLLLGPLLRTLKGQVADYRAEFPGGVYTVEYDVRTKASRLLQWLGFERGEQVGPIMVRYDLRKAS